MINISINKEFKWKLMIDIVINIIYFYSIIIFFNITNVFITIDAIDDNKIFI